MRIDHIPFWDICYGQSLGIIIVETTRGRAVGYGLEIRVIAGRLPFDVPSEPVALRKGQFAQFHFFPPYFVHTHASR